jgi:hypothetical protein
MASIYQRKDKEGKVSLDVQLSESKAILSFAIILIENKRQKIGQPMLKERLN